MRKILFKYTLIILINLFAFLAVWYILDAIFETNWKIVVVFLILSIFSLVIISQYFMKINLEKLSNIKPIKKDEKDWTNNE
jgi:positive regulator of sigma E activity